MAARATDPVPGLVFDTTAAAAGLQRAAPASVSGLRAMNTPRGRKRRPRLDLERQNTAHASHNPHTMHRRMQARPRALPALERPRKKPLLRRGTRNRTPSPDQASASQSTLPATVAARPEPAFRIVPPHDRPPLSPTSAPAAPSTRITDSPPTRVAVKFDAPTLSDEPATHPGLGPVPRPERSRIVSPGAAHHARAAQLEHASGPRIGGLGTSSAKQRKVTAAQVGKRSSAEPRARANGDVHASPVPPSIAAANRPKDHAINRPATSQSGIGVGAGVGAHRGLQSRGNTCYLNSVLQVLVHTAPLVNLCRSAPLQEASAPALALGQLAAAVVGGGTNAVVPRTFYETLPPPLVRGRQEDAHEYLRLLLDAVGSASSVATETTSASLDAAGAVSTSLFQGRFRSRVTCLSCLASSDTFDAFADVSLDISSGQVTSVSDALSGFTRVDRLAEGNEYVCPSCATKSAATKQFTIHEPPAQVLTIHLKRFDWTGTKLLCPIAFPLQLDLRPYMSAPQAGAQGAYVYELYAVIHHFGAGAHEGHYVASIRDKVPQYNPTRRPRWFRFDDDRVAPHTLDTADPSVYMLFYLHRQLAD